jgi:hypothetical protein
METPEQRRDVCRIEYDRIIPAAMRVILGERVTPEYYSVERVLEIMSDKHTDAEFGTARLAAERTRDEVRRTHPESVKAIVESEVECAMTRLVLEMARHIEPFDLRFEQDRANAAKNVDDPVYRSSYATLASRVPIAREGLVLQALSMHLVRYLTEARMAIWMHGDYDGPLRGLAE